MTQDINAALDEISEALQTLLDNCSRKAYDDLGKIHQSAQSRVDDLRELQSHVAAHDVVDLEAIKRELRGVIFPYSAVEKVIDHLAARGLLRTTPEDAKWVILGYLHEVTEPDGQYHKMYSAQEEIPWKHWKEDHQAGCRYKRTALFGATQQPEHDMGGV